MARTLPRQTKRTPLSGLARRWDEGLGGERGALKAHTCPPLDASIFTHSDPIHKHSMPMQKCVHRTLHMHCFFPLCGDFLGPSRHLVDILPPHPTAKRTQNVTRHPFGVPLLSKRLRRSLKPWTSLSILVGTLFMEPFSFMSTHPLPLTPTTTTTICRNACKDGPFSPHCVRPPPP